MTDKFPPEVWAQVERLFRAEAEAVFRAALHAAHGDRQVAEDAVQEAFQQAAKHWHTIGRYSSKRQRAWLCQVAINKVIDDYRKRSRFRFADPTDMGEASPSAEEVVLAREEASEQATLTRLQAERCLQVIREMPEMRSKVAYRKFHEGWANRRIAEDLGIQPGTVGKHVSDAKADLKKALPELVIIDDPDEDADADGEDAP